MTIHGADICRCGGLLRWLRSRSPGLTEDERINIRCGLPRDFKLPYPYPRNEHEDGMNYVAVNRVMSGRAGW